MRLIGKLLSLGPLLALVACKTTGLSTETPSTTLAPADAVPVEALPAARTGAGDGELRFVAVGDTGKGNQGQRDVAHAISAHCKRFGCDFVLLLGDNIYESGVSSVDDPLFQSRFEEPYADIALPFYAVLGNHDYGTNGAGLDLWRGEYEVRYTARSKKWRMPAEYYHFDRPVGGGSNATRAEFFGLDTHMLLLGKATQQKKDVAAWLSASSAKWKIAFGHHPFISNGPHGNAGEYNGVPLFGTTVKHYFEEAICGKADFYFAGHDHTLQLIDGGCGGTALFVAGTGAQPTHNTTKNAVYYQSEALGFMYNVLRPDGLNVSAVDAAGVIKFARTYRKSL